MYTEGGSFVSFLCGDKRERQRSERFEEQVFVSKLIE